MEFDEYRGKSHWIDTSGNGYLYWSWTSDFVPAIKQLYAYYEHRDDVEFLSVFNDTMHVKGDMRPCFVYAAEQHDVRWPLAMTDQAPKTIKELAACTYPNSFTLVSPEGRVLTIVKATPLMNGDQNALIDPVRQMISEYKGPLSP